MNHQILIIYESEFFLIIVLAEITLSTFTL